MKLRFHSKQVKGTYFENGFCKERVIASSYLWSLQANPSPRLFFWPPLPTGRPVPNPIPSSTSTAASVLTKQIKRI